MEGSSATNIGRGYIAAELVFGIMISSISLAKSINDDSKHIMLVSLIFDLIKIGIALVLIQLFNHLSKKETMSNKLQALFIAMNVSLTLAIAMISHVVCMTMCMHVWDMELPKTHKAFPGLRHLSIVFLVLFSILRVGLFTAFTVSFSMFVRRGKCGEKIAFGPVQT